MKLFSTEGKLYTFVTRLWDIIKVSLLWLLCSLPIVTIGASTVALNAITLQMVDNKEGYVAKDFFRFFKENLKKGIPMGLLCILLGYAIYLDFQLLNVIESGYYIVFSVGIISIFIWLMTFVYAFSLLARYENGFWATLKNSYEIAIHHFFRTLLVILVVGIELVVIFWNYTTMLVGLLVGAGLISYTVNCVAIRIFREIEKKNANEGIEPDKR